MDEQFDFDVRDYIAIQQLVALYGHIIDDRQWSRIDELFTEDAVFDTTASGFGRREGREAILQHWKETARHPLAHHVTNVVIVPTGPVKRRSAAKVYRPGTTPTRKRSSRRHPVIPLRRFGCRVWFMWMTSSGLPTVGAFRSVGACVCILTRCPRPASAAPERAPHRGARASLDDPLRMGRTSWRSRFRRDPLDAPCS